MDNGLFTNFCSSSFWQEIFWSLVSAVFQYSQLRSYPCGGLQGEALAGETVARPSWVQAKPWCTGTALTHTNPPLRGSRPNWARHSSLSELVIRGTGTYHTMKSAWGNFWCVKCFHRLLFRLGLLTSRGPNSRSDIPASKSVLFGETRSCQNVLFWRTKVSPNFACFTSSNHPKFVGYVLEGLNYPMKSFLKGLRAYFIHSKQVFQPSFLVCQSDSWMLCLAEIVLLYRNPNMEFMIEDDYQMENPKYHIIFTHSHKSIFEANKERNHFTFP